MSLDDALRVFCIIQHSLPCIMELCPLRSIRLNYVLRKEIT